VDNFHSPHIDQNIVSGKDIVLLDMASTSSHSAISAVCYLLMGDPIAIPTKIWHSTDHSVMRDTVQQWISYLISQRRPSASIEWLARLPEVARRLERRLYISAQSIEG
jgi:hypothetical protein